jgi:stress response protein YsnF
MPEDAVHLTDSAVVDKPATVQVLEETVEISKVRTLSGKVRVATSTQTFEDTVQASLEHQEVEVTRVLIDRIIEIAPGIRVEGEVTIVPVLEEVLVIEKRLLLKEELHIRRHVSTETVREVVILRRQSATVTGAETEGDRVVDD